MFYDLSNKPPDKPARLARVAVGLLSSLWRRERRYGDWPSEGAHRHRRVSAVSARAVSAGSILTRVRMRCLALSCGHARVHGHECFLDEHVQPRSRGIRILYTMNPDAQTCWCRVSLQRVLYMHACILRTRHRTRTHKQIPSFSVVHSARTFFFQRRTSYVRYLTPAAGCTTGARR